ncbi:MAG: hypothetical protein RL258_331 [Pseudomonadota bacterium]
MIPKRSEMSQPAGLQKWWGLVAGRRSLQARLAMVSLLAVCAVLLVAHSVLVGLFERQVTRQFESTLTIQLDQLTAGIEMVGDPPQISVQEPSADPRWSKPYSGVYWQVSTGLDSQNAALAVVLRSRSLWDFTLAVPGDDLTAGVVHIHRIAGPAGQTLVAAERSVVLDSETNPTPVRLVIASDSHELAVSVASFTRSVMQYLVALGLMMALVVAVQLAYGLAPLRALERALARLREGKAETLNGRFPSEVAPLVGQFNAVLAEQRRNLQRARSLAGNLAHAMKTPLTVIANAAQDPRIEGQQLRETVQHYGALAEKQVAWHLKRARMAASTTGHYTPVRVAEVLRGLITVLHRAHPEKSVEVLCDVPLTLRFLGEREDLQEILGNLLDNAFKWARASVAVSVAQSEDHIFLFVDDDGPGVPAARYGEILQRGTRLDEVVPGSGLGLAIVAELVALYNGSIAFSESAQGGLRVQLALPMAPG